MKILTVDDSHVSEIVQVWKESWDFHKNLEPTYFSMSQDGLSRFEEYLRGLMKSDNAQVLVTMDQGHVIAYSISQILRRIPVAKQEDYGFISDLGVKAECRRRGLGEQMLNEILTWFDSRNVKRIELQVFAKNEIGFSFWKKHGFEVMALRMFLVR
ncbi:MAG: GNAT family N-acetyltransferase [Candidatus Zixiibacteriota bacterium]